MKTQSQNTQYSLETSNWMPWRGGKLREKTNWATEPYTSASSFRGTHIRCGMSRWPQHKGHLFVFVCYTYLQLRSMLSSSQATRNPWLSPQDKFDLLYLTQDSPRGNLSPQGAPNKALQAFSELSSVLSPLSPLSICGQHLLCGWKVLSLPAAGSSLFIPLFTSSPNHTHC